ncbi:UPSTREAM OF FLC protein [Nymphaea thermarum]|nr:UPSTREAM OF FLC protein [Nymphaea thermarum]
MAVSPRRGRVELPLGKKKNREASPERTMVWVEPRAKQEKKVSDVYYLCRNGQLEQPHFMEVPLSSSDGLYLRDVMNRLNLLRGKVSYKNGFVWHDLSENDFIYPIHGHEYVLKGSEIVIPLPTAKVSSVSNWFMESKQLHELSLEASCSSRTGRSGDSGLASSRKIPDATEYKVYKAECPAEFYAKATDASTQTEDRRRQFRKEAALAISVAEPAPTELNAEEVSPPASTSSASSGTDGKDQPEPESLETLMKADGRLRCLRIVEEEEEAPELYVRAVNHARVRASTVLMQLISCGSMLADRPKLPHGGSQGHRKARSAEAECVNPTRMQLEEREYFSGSLIETQRKEQRALEGAPRLKRSSSYNADR